MTQQLGENIFIERINTLLIYKVDKIVLYYID